MALQGAAAVDALTARRQGWKGHGVYTLSILHRLARGSMEGGFGLLEHSELYDNVKPWTKSQIAYGENWSGTKLW